MQELRQATSGAQADHASDRGDIDMNMDKTALEKIELLREERDHYKSVSDTLQATLEETEEALRAAKGQIQHLLNDRRFPDLKVG